MTATDKTVDIRQSVGLMVHACCRQAFQGASGAKAKHRPMLGAKRFLQKCEAGLRVGLGADGFHHLAEIVCVNADLSVGMRRGNDSRRFFSLENALGVPPVEAAVF